MITKKIPATRKFPPPPPPHNPPITFLMVRPLGLFGGASAKRDTRNRTQLRHVCHLQLDFWTYRGRFHLSLSYCQGLLVVVLKFNMTVASSKLIGSLCTQSNKACLPKCDLTYFFVQLCFDSITYRHQTTIVQHKVTCRYRWLSDCKTNHSWLTYVRLLAFAAKLCTSSGVKLLRWLPDWLPTTTGFCCETLHQFWCETFTVIAWLTTSDYWLLLRNFEPVLVWNCYGDCLTDYVRRTTYDYCLNFAAKLLRWLSDDAALWLLGYRKNEWVRSNSGWQAPTSAEKLYCKNEFSVWLKKVNCCHSIFEDMDSIVFLHSNRKVLICSQALT